ncbi:hypothetical protein [Streptomyces rhizosphaericus]|uniref:hypothetical protein n=1 Tax=Streptomyces rhizosphaericus TaxID=114699 RepID=UPI00117EF85F|nr:hypothetical protein [Streptomyces rhizosphaericus]
MAELGDLFDLSLRRLQRFPADLARHITTQAFTIRDHAMLVQQTACVVHQAKSFGDRFDWDAAALKQSRPSLRRDATEVLNELHKAHRELIAYLPDDFNTSGPHTALSRNLADTVRILGAGRDLLASHYGPDGEPRTVFTLLLTRSDARRYLLARIADVAWQTSLIVRALADYDRPEARSPLNQARAHLENATVLGRHAARGAADHLASLPATDAPAHTPADGGFRLWHLVQLCHRLQHTTILLTRPDTPALSGSDLFLLARPLAISHLAASGMLAATDTTRRPEVAHTTVALEAAARAWHHAGRTWNRIVDVANPRAAPQVAAAGPTTVGRRRKPFRHFPRPPLHPAVTDARALAHYMTSLRTALNSRRQHQERLHPRQGPGTHPLQELVTALRPLPAAARILAVHTPTVLAALRPGLVSDDAESPLEADRLLFRPADRSQLVQLHFAYRTAAHSSANAIRSFEALATSITAIPTERTAYDTAIELQWIRQGVNRGAPPSPS